MRTPDAFAAYPEHLIEAAYDCVDRLVVNCCYPLGQAGGGCRTFWRQWQGGDSGLSGEALRQAAGDLARRLKAHCQQQGILWIECGAGDLKYEIAREHRPQDPAFRGVFAVLVGRAPAPLWEVRRNGQGQITELRRTEPWRYVQHYYFQIIDPLSLLGFCPAPGRAAAPGRRNADESRLIRARWRDGTFIKPVLVKCRCGGPRSGALWR